MWSVVGGGDEVGGTGAGTLCRPQQPTTRVDGAIFEAVVVLVHRQECPVRFLGRGVPAGVDGAFRSGSAACFTRLDARSFTGVEARSL